MMTIAQYSHDLKKMGQRNDKKPYQVPNPLVWRNQLTTETLWTVIHVNVAVQLFHLTTERNARPLTSPKKKTEL